MPFVARLAAWSLAGYALFACARTLGTLNEYLDPSIPAFEDATVLSRGQRFIPFPVSTLRVRLSTGSERTIEVLDKTAAEVRLGGAIELVRSRGAFGREWIEHADFYRELRGTMGVTSVVYAATLILLTGVIYFWLKFLLCSRKAALMGLPVALFISIGLFYVLP